MLKGWKTTLFNILLAFIGVVKIVAAPDVELPTEAEAAGLSEQAEGFVTVGIAFVNQILRAVTTLPIFKKN